VNVGTNTITTVVTAQDGVTTDTYTITVTRAAPVLSSDADLSSLIISSGILAPVFAPGTTSYSATVSSNISSITLTPTASDPNAVITLNGLIIPSGTATDPINLSVGANTITITVIAPDQSTIQTYTLVVTRTSSILVIPNAFTPNSDGINDIWTIQNINLYPNSTVRIFNRYGQIVFSSIGYGIPWDGTYNNSPLPPGAYYYIIDLKTRNIGVFSGSVIIFRK